MNKFEEYLLGKGFIRCHTVKEKGETVMKQCDEYNLNLVDGDLAYYYVPMTNKKYSKLLEGKFVKSFTKEENNDIIVFGFNEQKKPATLLQPRPNISIDIDYDCLGLKIKRNVRQNEDDAMIYVLETKPHDEVFKAMYDRSIVL